MAPEDLLNVTRRARQEWSQEFTLERFRGGVTSIIAQARS
jgi:hypothetical protein